MVATLNFWVAMNWASSGAMLMGWNLAPSPSTAMRRLPLWRASQRAWMVSACLGSMRWSVVSTP